MGIGGGQDFDWTVVGAGPAGIAAVGKLLDEGVSPQRLAWIDPSFSVGDFGTKWANVPSNTQVGLFLKYLQASPSFNYGNCLEDFALNHVAPDQTCFLGLMVEPLEWITQQLMQRVTVMQDFVEALEMKNQHWELKLSRTSLLSKNVVLAIGAEPKKLSNPGVETISLEMAMNSEKIADTVCAEDTIAVFGSSHSAVLILRYLLEFCSVKKVINFYRTPLRYAIYLDNEILYDDTGLKGSTAEWARANLHGKPINRLQRIISSQTNIENYLPHCNKAIYAIGFERRKINISGLNELTYNPYTGIIAPGLFGLGIAFPEAKTDRFGNLEYRVGLWKFIEYGGRILSCDKF